MAEIKNHNGRPAIFINDVPYPPMMATIRIRNGKEVLFDKEYFENLGKAGIKIYFLICDTVDLYPESLELFDIEAKSLLEAVPDAYIVLRMGMHPTNEWIEANPDECIKYSDGTSPSCHLYTESYETDLPHHYSLGSQKWREERAESLKNTLKLIRELPYSDRIIGCFLAAGGTSEWYYMLPALDVKNKRNMGYSPAFKREFSKYLTDKYKTDENLQAHWKNPNATLADPPIPEYAKHYFVMEVDDDCNVPKTRIYANTYGVPSPKNGFNFGSFPDFNVATDVHDFYRAWSLATAESVSYFASCVKSVAPEYLVGAFYGSQGSISYVQSGSTGGCLKVLNDKNIDFLAAPGVYEFRLPGGCTGQREVQDSFALRNKIFIVEDDARTSAETPFHKSLYQIYDMTDTIDVLKREFGRTICEDVQAWWFDQLIGGKRFKDPAIYELFKKQTEIANEAYALNREKNSEIALIIDEESMQGASLHTTRDTVELFRNYEMARIGAPIDQYYHNDMSDPNMPDYKLYVFVNSFIITPEEREVIHKKLKKNGAVALWIYAPGIIDPTSIDNKISEDNIEALTGIKCKIENEKHDSHFRWNGTEHKISEKIDKREVFGTIDRKRLFGPVGQKFDIRNQYDTYMFPTVYSIDENAENPAYFLTSGLPAVTVKECSGFTSILHGSKYLKNKTLREIARFAGCHIYNEVDDTLYANRNYLTLHSSKTEKKHLKFQDNVTLTEVYENKVYCENSKDAEFDMYHGETKMFRIEKK